MKLRWCMLLVGILCLAMLPALAASPDLGTLRYIPPQAPTAELSETTQPGNRVIPLDLWMDATPNMGGINLVEDTLYPTGSSAKYYQGGFHYLWQDNYREFHGWYVDLLTALPELLGPQRSQVRVLRYDDGLFSPELLDRHGLTASTLEAAASLQRDLRTWATRATGETFTEMVQPGPENFYAPGTASAARADQVQLENPAQAQALLAAQQEGLALQQAGDPSALVNREEGGSHLLTALRYLDPTHLNLITLDTWSLGSLDAVVDGQLTDPYAAVLAERGFFDGGDTAMTVFALRMDYVGAITSFAWETPAEALQWGRLSRGNSGLWRECAMPRCMLLLLLGPQSEVAETAQRLDALFAGEVFTQVRGFQDGDGPVTVVNYFYEGREDHALHLRLCLRAGGLPPGGGPAGADPRKRHRHDPQRPGGGPDPDRNPAPRKGPLRRPDLHLALSHFPEPGAGRGCPGPGRGAVPGGQPDPAGNPAQYRSGAASPRKRGHPIHPVPGHAVCLCAPERPGGRHPDGHRGERGGRAHPVPGRRCADPGLADLPPEPEHPRRRLGGPRRAELAGETTARKGTRTRASGTMTTGSGCRKAGWSCPEALHDAGAQTRSRLADSLRHAWCDGNAALTLDRVPNIPPVFRLLEAGELLTRLRQSALRVETPLARLDVTIFCDMESEVSP